MKASMGLRTQGLCVAGHRGTDDFLEGPVFGSGTYEGFVGLGLCGEG